MSSFSIAVLKPAHGKKAVKRRLLEPNGDLVKFDHTLFVKMWLMANVSVPNDADLVAELLRKINSRSDIATVHGAVAPGIIPSELQPRWSSESHGASRTLLDADRFYIPFDIDKAPLTEGSAAGKGENLYAFAEQAREEILPRAFRHCELVIRASSSTGLNLTRGSLHAYALLEQPAPLAAIYRWLKGCRRAASLSTRGQPLQANCFCLVGLSLSALPIPCPSICASSCCLDFSAHQGSIGASLTPRWRLRRRASGARMSPALNSAGGRSWLVIWATARVGSASSIRCRLPWATQLGRASLPTRSLLRCTRLSPRIPTSMPSARASTRSRGCAANSCACGPRMRCAKRASTRVSTAVRARFPRMEFWA